MLRMAKRVGANRKRFAVSRKKKIGSGLKKGFSKFILASVVLTGVVVAFIGGKVGYTHIKKYFDNSTMLSVKSIVVEGAMLSVKDSVIARCGLTSGMKLYKIAEKKINQAACSDVWIDNIKIKKHLNGFVYLSIHERKPIAVVNVGNIMLVDKNGVLLPFRSRMTLDMPIISGLKDSLGENKIRILKRNDLFKLQSFVAQMQKNDEFNTIVSQVDFSRNDRVRIACKSSKIVIETVLEHVGNTFDKLRYIENSLTGDNGKPAHINMMYDDIAFVIQDETVKDVVLKAVND
jgi:cell division septal protein FtsQ